MGVGGGGREGGGRGGRTAHSAEKESASWLFLFVFVLHFFLLSEFFSLLVLCQVLFSFLPLRVPFPPSHVPPPPPTQATRPPSPPGAHTYAPCQIIFIPRLFTFPPSMGGVGEPGLPSPPPPPPPGQIFFAYYFV